MSDTKIPEGFVPKCPRIGFDRLWPFESYDLTEAQIYLGKEEYGRCKAMLESMEPPAVPPLSLVPDSHLEEPWAEMVEKEGFGYARA